MTAAPAMQREAIRLAVIAVRGGRRLALLRRLRLLPAGDK
jgi:hypothetical protein